MSWSISAEVTIGGSLPNRFGSLGVVPTVVFSLRFGFVFSLRSRGFHQAQAFQSVRLASSVPK